MKYMGSKRRIAKEILPIILKDRKEGQWYVEPFVGGCNTMDKVDGKRIGNDSHPYLIRMWQALQNGWIPPDLITEEMYYHIREHKEEYDPVLVGYVGFSFSFGARWFGPYRRDKRGQYNDPENMANQSRRSKNEILRQAPLLIGVHFSCKDYKELIIPNNSIIYNDIPYEGTTGYKENNSFNHKEFWKWCEYQAEQSHQVFVSEYTAPDNWKCIWEKEIPLTLNDKGENRKTSIEKLFTL